MLRIIAVSNAPHHRKRVSINTPTPPQASQYQYPHTTTSESVSMTQIIGVSIHAPRHSSQQCPTPS